MGDVASVVFRLTILVRVLHAVVSVALAFGIAFNFRFVSKLCAGNSDSQDSVADITTAGIYRVHHNDQKEQPAVVPWVRNQRGCR